MGTINFGEVKTDSNNSATQNVPAEKSTQGLDNLISNFTKKLDEQKNLLKTKQKMEKLLKEKSSLEAKLSKVNRQLSELLSAS